MTAMIETPLPTLPDPISIESFGQWCDQANVWPLPGSGETERRFGLLTSVARRDLVLGRLVEAHADAVAVGAELGAQGVASGQRWGVWAAGPADAVRATRRGHSWRLDGIKSWCSGATLLTHALVDAVASSGSQLFAVDLSDPGVMAQPATWVGAGMARADTRKVTFDGAGATPIGGPGRYLTRPGFWAGAIGVAACWHGGSLAVADPLLERSRTSSDPHLFAHLGAVHVALEQNRCTLRVAAADVDDHPNSSHALMAGSARTTVERNAVEVMDRVGRALGPAPLAHDAIHSATVADLTVYIRQHHAERDLEQIGHQVAEMGEPWPG